MLLPAALLAAVGILPALLLPARPAAVTRLVTAEVSVGGEVVLRASKSDDGRPDADAVWAYLRTLRLVPTGEGWGLDPAGAERWFAHRSSRRGWAARLEEPQRTTLASR